LIHFIQNHLVFFHISNILNFVQIQHSNTLTFVTEIFNNAINRNTIMASPACHCYSQTIGSYVFVNCFSNFGIGINYANDRFFTIRTILITDKNIIIIVSYLTNIFFKFICSQNSNREYIL